MDSSFTVSLPSSFAHHEHETEPKGTFVVDWNGPADPENPRNWSIHQRWIVTGIVSLFTFISPVASSIPSPSLPTISAHLQISPGSVLENMTLSIFVLAYAIGPLLWGPLSEIYGRVPILQLSNIWFLIFNTLCSLSKTPTQMLVFRFLAGLGGAAPQSIGAAIVGDLWSPAERGMAMGVYSLAPLVGPATGPFVGGWIAQRARWEWVFWSVSIADALIQVLGFIFIRETYAPQLLKLRARSMGKSNPELSVRSVYEEEIGARTWIRVMRNSITKPLVFLVKEPIVQICALYMAVLYGVLYLFLTTFIEVWTVGYGEGEGIAGVHYLSIALGSTVGGQAGARVLNHVYGKLRSRNGGVGTPEMRLPLLMITSATLPVGLLLYGWSAQKKLYWLVPDIGVFIFSIGIGGNWTCIQTYLVDNYAVFAASAVAGVTSFRALAGFGFPLLASDLYGRLGQGWGNSILALICLVIGCPAPFLFYRYGSLLRKRSQWCTVEQ